MPFIDTDKMARKGGGMDWRARRAPSPAVLAFLMMGELGCAAAH